MQTEKDREFVPEQSLQPGVTGLLTRGMRVSAASSVQGVAYRIRNENGAVFLDFSRPVQMIVLAPPDAYDLARELQHRAKKSMKHPNALPSTFQANIREPENSKGGRALRRSKQHGSKFGRQPGLDKGDAHA